MQLKLAAKGVQPYLVGLNQFITDGKLQRHPQTHFESDIPSDQAHMYYLATGEFTESMRPETIFSFWPRTLNKNLVSYGMMAHVSENWIAFNLSLLIQIILFWIPVRWHDGNNPSVRIGPIKLDIGFRHHAGDYRLFKQCLYYAPVWIRRLVSKKTLKKMSAIYWEPEPNAQWLLEIDSRFVDACL